MERLNEKDCVGVCLAITLGQEIVAEAVKVIDRVNQLHSLEIVLDYADLGGAAIDNYGNPCPDITLDKAKLADAILLGAVGGPQWDSVDAPLRPEKGLLAIRSKLDLFANLRPCNNVSTIGGRFFIKNLN